MQNRGNRYFENRFTFSSNKNMIGGIDEIPRHQYVTRSVERKKTSRCRRKYGSIFYFTGYSLFKCYENIINAVRFPKYIAI